MLHLLIEWAFAVLPLLVLSAYWPSHEQGHPESFWWGPEVSATSCILYGLALSKLVMGTIGARKSHDTRHNLSLVVTVLSISMLVLAIRCRPEFGWNSLRRVSG